MGVRMVIQNRNQASPTQRRDGSSESLSAKHGSSKVIQHPWLSGVSGRILIHVKLFHDDDSCRDSFPKRADSPLIESWDAIKYGHRCKQGTSETRRLSSSIEILCFGNSAIIIVIKNEILLLGIPDNQLRQDLSSSSKISPSSKPIALRSPNNHIMTGK